MKSSIMIVTYATLAMVLVTGPVLGSTNWPVTPTNIRIEPGNEMWLEDNGKHPFLVGVYESAPISNFWGDPGKEYNTDGSRANPPVTYPTGAGFHWRDYLDAVASHGLTCLRTRVVPGNLDTAGDPYEYTRHYNAYPYPWVRTDANRFYEPGYLQSESQTNFDYLHSAVTCNFSQPQAEYFQYRVRRFCQEAKNRNIYVILTIVPYGYYLPYDSGNADMQAYVDMLLSHTQDLGNVLYEINWEAGNGTYLKYWANYVKNKLAAAGRPQNVIIVNQGTAPCVNPSSSEYTIVGHHRKHEHSAAFGGCYTGGVLESRQWGKPIIWTEDFTDPYSDNHHWWLAADTLRHHMWFSFVAGVHYLWYDWCMHKMDEGGQDDSYNDPTLFNAAQSLVTFLSATDPPFWTMSPYDELASGGYNWCLANPGNHYIVYFSEGVGSGTTLTLSGGPFKARWFNPKAGDPLIGEFIGNEFDTPGNGIFTRPAGSTTSDKLVLYVYKAANFVSIDLGTTDIEQGLSRVVVDDGDTVPATIGGREARRNDNPNQDYYFYFDVSDSFAYQGNKLDLYIKIDYYDTGSGSLILEYDATGSIYKNGGSVALSGTDTWKQHAYHVTDAYFGNRQNNGADFRIAGGVGNTFYLDVVGVSVDSHLPSKAADPSPTHQAMDISITADLGWAAAERATSYDVYFGSTGETAFQRNQVETTFNPGTMDLLTLYYWRIDTVNNQGTTTGDVWSFTTGTYPGDFDEDLDVDQEDFVYFQACYSGSGIPYEVACEDANLDGDDDVDLDDFAIFQACMGGPNKPPVLAKNVRCAIMPVNKGFLGLIGVIKKLIRDAEVAGSNPVAPI